MSTEKIFRQDAEIPDIVQQKANLALAQIYERKDEETAKEAALKEKSTSSKKAPRAVVIKLITTLVAAVITVAVALLAIALFAGRDIGGHGNRFTIKVCAAELEKGYALPISENLKDRGFTHGEDSDGNVSYAIRMPITVEGDNIESVSYKINSGCFQVVSIDRSSIVSGGQKNNDPHSPSTFEEGYDSAGQYLGSTVVEYYDNFSIDYEACKDSKYVLNIVNALKDRMDLFNMFAYSTSDEITAAALTSMVKDTVITVEVRFKDGTVTAKELGLFAKLYNAPGAAIPLAGYFCYGIGDADEETKKLIEEQVSNAEEYVKKNFPDDGEAGSDDEAGE